MLKSFTKLFVLFLIMGVFTSCSEDSTSSNNNSNGPPSFDLRTIAVPDAMMQSNDPNAMIASSYINIANSFNSYTTFFNPQGQATDDGEYEWTSGGTTVRLVWDEVGDSYEWDIYITGDLGGQMVDNWHYMSAEALKDGSEGTWVVYDPSTQNILNEWNWTIDSNDVYNMVMNYFGGQLLITSNPDKSGSIEVYSDSVLNWAADWNSAGAGNWQSYDSEGNLADSGSW